MKDLYSYSFGNQSKPANFSDLVGCVISKIEGSEGGSALVFHTDRGEYHMFHYQDCCEYVYLAEVIGDLQDLIGSPVLDAREEHNPAQQTGYGTETWTFYIASTIKGSVTLRWYGSSNGYYSEAVSFAKLKQKEV